MTRIIKLLVLAAVLAIFAIHAIAQADQCNDDNKAAWYKTFLDNYTKPEGQKAAYDAAKKYIDSCPDDPQRQYMQKFVAKREINEKKALVGKAFEEAVT